MILSHGWCFLVKLGFSKFSKDFCKRHRKGFPKSPKSIVKLYYNGDMCVTHIHESLILFFRSCLLHKDKANLWKTPYTGIHSYIRGTHTIHNLLLPWVEYIKLFQSSNTLKITILKPSFFLLHMKQILTFGSCKAIISQNAHN